MINRLCYYFCVRIKGQLCVGILAGLYSILFIEQHHHLPGMKTCQNRNMPEIY
jgi:hypothetical protein